MAESGHSRTLSVLYVGNGEPAEFRPARSLLESTTALAQVSDVPAACEILSRHQFAADLILVEQARPGEPGAIARLREAAPLAGIWILSGSWADGEERTGRQSPLAERIPWSRFAQRWQTEFRSWSRGGLPSWQLPLTATPEERLLKCHAQKHENRDTAPATCVAVYSDHRAAREWLTEACRTVAAAVVASPASSPAEAPDARLALVDFDELTPWQEAVWRTIAALTPNARRIVLLGFPRWHDAAVALRWGADDVWEKPLEAGMLGRELRSLGR